MLSDSVQVFRRQMHDNISAPGVIGVRSLAT